MKGMLLAAGLGTRLKPFTDKHPKALAQVNGKTVLQKNIEYLAQYGITDIIVNVHHFADQIIQTVEANNGFGSNLIISDERNEVLETGGGIKKASWFFEKEKEPFVVMNVDILTDMHMDEMIKEHQEKKPLATLAVTQRKTSRYFLFDELDHLCGWKNILTGEQKITRPAEKLTEKAFSGIHILEPRIFSLMERKGKFSMVDAYLDFAKQHFINFFDHSDSKFIDVGKPENLLEAANLFP